MSSYIDPDKLMPFVEEYAKAHEKSGGHGNRGILLVDIFKDTEFYSYLINNGMVIVHESDIDNIKK